MDAGKQGIVEELQMITGVMSDDLDYLVYRMLEGGCYFAEERKEVPGMDCVSVVKDLKDWFESL